MLDLRKRLREAGITLAVDFQGLIKSAFVCSFSRAERYRRVTPLGGTRAAGIIVIRGLWLQSRHMLWTGNWKSLPRREPLRMELLFRCRKESLKGFCRNGPLYSRIRRQGGRASNGLWITMRRSVTGLASGI